jgi:hypothetical protein
VRRLFEGNLAVFAKAIEFSVTKGSIQAVFERESLG